MTAPRGLSTSESGGPQAGESTLPGEDAEPELRHGLGPDNTSPWASTCLPSLWTFLDLSWGRSHQKHSGGPRCLIIWGCRLLPQTQAGQPPPLGGGVHRTVTGLLGLERVVSTC